MALRLALMSDRPDAAVFERLLWAVRWLAAEPAAAMAAVELPWIVPDEIALDFGDWLEVVRSQGPLDGPLDELLSQIDEHFSLMSEPGNGHHWTPEAVTSSKEWADQRERARDVLALLGEERADDDLRGRV